MSGKKGGAEFLPQVILAGAPKCGTSSVFDYLAGHPEICASSVKETYYLMDEDYPLYNEHASIHRHGWSGYAQFFSSCSGPAGMRFEATPDYLYQKTPLLELPRWPAMPRIIFFLREPASRVYSLIRFAQNNVGVLDKDLSFSEFLDMLIRSPENFENLPILYNAINNGHYINYLADWVDAFGMQHIQLYLFEDLVNEPLETMHAVSKFIGIDPNYYKINDFKVKNKSIGVKSQWLQGIKKNIAGSLGNGIVHKGLSHLYRSINEMPLPKKTEADLESLAGLRESYRTSNQQLEEKFNVDLKSWR